MTTTPSTSTALVPVFAGSLAGHPAQLCNARDLHKVLQVGDRFDQWVSRRITEYGFADGEDYCTVLCNRSGGTAGKRRTDYHLSLDMAKELSMVENNEIGRQVRRYFLALERQQAQPTTPALPSPEQQQSERKRQSRINQRAWQLAHLAYEHYRQEMQTCDYLARGVWQIEEWQPRLLAHELVSDADALERICENYAVSFRRMAQSLRQMTGSQ